MRPDASRIMRSEICEKTAAGTNFPPRTPHNRMISEVHRLRRHVNHEARGRHQHERVRRSAKNTSLNTARPGVPRTSTRGRWSSTVTTAASGDPVGSAAAGSADSDTTGTNDSVSAEAGSTNWPKRARRRQSCTCWGRHPWRRATSVTIAPTRGFPRQSVPSNRPASAFDQCLRTLRYAQRSSCVARMVVPCEHPCRR